jgi:hypothetical protein
MGRKAVRRLKRNRDDAATAVIDEYPVPQNVATNKNDYWLASRANFDKLPRQINSDHRVKVTSDVFPWELKAHGIKIVRCRASRRAGCNGTNRIDL